MTDPNTSPGRDVPPVPGQPDAPRSPADPPAPPPSYAAPAYPASPPPATPAYAPANPYPANLYPANPYAATPAKKQPMLSIFAMIAGIIGLLGGAIAFIPFIGGFLGLFFPVAAVVLGFLGKKREPQARGFWITGIVTGFVAVGLMLLSIVLWAIVFATANSNNYYGYGYGA